MKKLLCLVALAWLAGCGSSAALLPTDSLSSGGSVAGGDLEAALADDFPPPGLGAAAPLAIFELRLSGTTNALTTPFANVANTKVVAVLRSPSQLDANLLNDPASGTGQRRVVDIRFSNGGALAPGLRLSANSALSTARAQVTYVQQDLPTRANSLLFQSTGGTVTLVAFDTIQRVATWRLEQVAMNPKLGTGSFVINGDVTISKF